jgi:hypothetical protein
MYFTNIILGSFVARFNAVAADKFRLVQFVSSKEKEPLKCSEEFQC